jgi:predicted amidohydrolase
MEFLACIWNPRTVVRPNNQGPTGLRDSMQRLKELEKKVAEAYAFCEKQALADQRSYLPYVFLAPEYYFSRAANRHFIEHSEKQAVVDAIRALSQQHPRMLLVPGTVAWWRKVRRNDGDDERIMKTGIRMMNRQTGFEPEDLVADIAKLKKDQDVYVAQNTAYIAYKGKVLKYHKFGNFNEIEGDEQDRSVVFAPGTASGRFRIGALCFGLEICLDHDMGFLKHSVSKLPDGVHVHLIVSANVEQESGKYATRGIVLHASSDPDVCDAKVASAGLGAKQALHKEKSPSNKYSWVQKLDYGIYKITLPESLVFDEVDPGDELESLYLAKAKRSG